MLIVEEIGRGGDVEQSFSHWCPGVPKEVVEPAAELRPVVMGKPPHPTVFLPCPPDLRSLVGSVQVMGPEPPSAPWKACRQKAETARPGCRLLGVTPSPLTLVSPVGSTWFLDRCIVDWLWEKVVFQRSVSSGSQVR